MDLNQIPIFSLISKKMSFLNKRQETIAGNLANADTPGYRAKLLKEPDFSSYLGDTTTHSGGLVLKIATTNPDHIKGSSATAGSSYSTLGGISTREAAIHGKEQYSPDGNSVNVSEQVMQMADTQMQYNLATNIYRKQVQLLKTAIGRG